MLNELINKDIHKIVKKTENLPRFIDFSEKENFNSDIKNILLLIRKKNIKIINKINFKFPFKFILSSYKPRRKKNVNDITKIILISLKFSKLLRPKSDNNNKKIILT
tara:strand:+ start:53 stop:373 length:321 start_codon:yes stop_codon:yes gene_type:complete